MKKSYERSSKPQAFKKILLVVPEYSSFYPMMKQAFSEMGISHQIFDNRKTNISEKCLVLLSKFVPSLKDLHINLLNKRLVNNAKKYQPNLILVIKGENIYPQTVDKLNNIAATVNWFPDSLPNFKLADAWLKAYKFIFIGDDYFVKFYSKKGYKNIYHLPWAGIKIKNISKKKIYDVVFIGAYNPDREKLFQNLADLNFKIWGSKEWGLGKLGGNYQGEWLSADKILEVLKQTKIVVNLHQNYNPNSSIVNLRVYESTSTKALIITDYWTDLTKLYSIGKDLLVYRNSSDLKEKINYYLIHEKERAKIAENGYKKLNSKNTYNHRFRQMFRIILTEGNIKTHLRFKNNSKDITK